MANLYRSEDAVGASDPQKQAKVSTKKPPAAPSWLDGQDFQPYRQPTKKPARSDAAVPASSNTPKQDLVVPETESSSLAQEMDILSQMGIFE